MTIRNIAFIGQNETPDNYAHEVDILEGPWADTVDWAITAYRIESGDRSRFVQTWLCGETLWIAVESSAEND